jgi:hypothetical protein
MHIQTTDGAQVCIFYAAGGYSGELFIGFRMITDDSEWIECFSISFGDDGGNDWEFLNTNAPMWFADLPPDEWNFK